MKLDTLKYTGLSIIGIILIYANINMVGKLFFSGSSNNIKMNLKTFVEPTNDEIAGLVKELYQNGISENSEMLSSLKTNPVNPVNPVKNKKDSLIVLDDPIESNKRHVISGDSLIAYAYVIHEQIACPTCSDINYLLITDINYIIKHIIFLRDIVEGYKIIPVEKFEEFSNQFLEMNLLNDDFMLVKVVSDPAKHSLYFKESIKKLQKQVRLFYEG